MSVGISGGAELTVALVEDNRSLRAALRQGLTEEGMRVSAAATAAEFLAILRGGARPDVMIIDIGLPDADGRDVCLAARSVGASCPVLFLSARAEVDDRISGFAAGGDDYLVKPFAFAELVARVRALARRNLSHAANQALANPSPSTLHLDPVSMSGSHNGVDLALTQTEFRVLSTLAARSGELVRRRQLAAAAWSGSTRVTDQAIDVAIARVRKKLAAAGGSVTITTVHGLGYKLQ